MSPRSTVRCRAMLTQISQWLDGDLKGSQRKVLAAHVRHCPCCEGVARELQRTVDACHKAGRTRLPRDVRERARQRIADLLAAAADPAAIPEGGETRAIPPTKAVRGPTRRRLTS
jgi:hypothetical protein